MINPQATNGIVMEIGERAGDRNPNVTIKSVKVKTNNQIKYFEITNSNWSPLQSAFNCNSWEQIHNVEIGEHVLIIHGNANRNDLGRNCSLDMQ